MGGSCLRGEGVDKTQNKERTVGEDFQRELQKCVCYEHSVVGGVIPQQEKKRWILGRQFSQSLAPLSALKTLHVKLSLLQIHVSFALAQVFCSHVRRTCSENLSANK